MGLGALIVVGVIALFLLSAIKVLKEYERGVIFTLGRFTGVKGPGLIIVIPIIQQMVKTDLRVIVMDVPTQDVISQDNVSVKVNAVVYFRMIDPEQAIIQVRTCSRPRVSWRRPPCARCSASTNWTRCCRSATS